jgi:hypothetical protein
MEEFAVVLVESTSQAMRLENLLHMDGIQSKLIPVPRFLSSSCGNCLRIDLSSIEAVKRVIEKHHFANASVEIVQM